MTVPPIDCSRIEYLIPPSGALAVTPLSAGQRFDAGMPDNDPNEAYDVIPMPEHWRGPKGWWTVMRDGIPVRHFPKRDGARAIGDGS